MTRQETFEKNMEVVERLHPMFARLIRETLDVPWCLEKGETGGRTNLRIMDSEAKELWVYSEQFLQGLDKEGTPSIMEKEVLADNAKGTIVFGVGAGHIVHEILKFREPKHVIVVVEPVFQMWRIALSEYDFTGVLADGTFFPCPGVAEIGGCLNWLEGNRTIEGWNRIIDRVAYKRAEYWALIDQTLSILNQTTGNVGTLESHGREIALNDIASLPWLIRHRGVIDLKGLFLDRPAIVVATGPSLMRNIHMLREVQESRSAVILAVAQALRPLLAHGIRPDLICTVDFGVVNMSHLEGVMDQDVPLVTISKTYEPLLRAYQGPKFISASSIGEAPDDSLAGMFNKCGTLMQGGSVLHMTVGLAACLGCNPIAMMGADLSYPTQTESHMSQVDSGGEIKVENGLLIWEVTDPRSPLAKKRSIMGEAIYVDGYYGEDVVTNAGLKGFITTLEKFAEMALASGTLLVDATEGGAYIRGTRRMFLKDFIKRHCTEPIEIAEKLGPLLSFSPEADARIDRAIELLGTDIQNLRRIREHSAQGIKWARKILKHRDKLALTQCIAKNAFHAAKAYEYSQKIMPMAYLLMATLRKAEIMMMSKQKEKNMSLKERTEALIDDSEVRENSVRRSVMVLRAALEGASELEDACRNAQSTLMQYRAGNKKLLEPVGNATPPSVDDADEYFRKENFARPLLEALRILKEDCINEKAIAAKQTAHKIREQIEERAILQQEQDKRLRRDLLPVYLDLVEDSRNLGRAGLKEPALEKIREAVELMPEKADARWGLATMLHENGRYGESLQEYEWLREGDPENLRYMFEAGQVMLKVEDRRAEGVALIRSVIERDPAKYGQYEKELESYTAMDSKT